MPMAEARHVVGVVGALWRYPVKSMQGEELNASAVGERGLLGDRTHALVDGADGKVGSAKNPRKWPGLFDFRAAYTEPPAPGAALPPVRITLPDGSVTRSDGADRDRLLSAVLGRPVSLPAAVPARPVLEEYWPAVEGLPHQDTVTDEAMPAGTFFDLATVHLLTTATLDRLRALYPDGRLEVRRFRPNVVVNTPAGQAGFVEDTWVGHTLALGKEVRLKITKRCGRCVMTTLAQADLPADLGILRTAVKDNAGHVGVYASVLQGGTVRRGDEARVE
jgi:uncharacterized protein YcbX